MEDILASIKRIIAEDSEAAVARSPRVRKGPVAVPDPEPALPDPIIEAPVAELPPVDVPEPVAEVTEPTAPVPVSEETADVLELTSPFLDSEPEAMPAPAAAPAPQVDVAETVVPGSSAGILSGASALASRNAFAALSQLQVRTDEAKPNTLEGLVADMLRPMLTDWLDRELPAIVERLVSDEIKRVSGRG